MPLYRIQGLGAFERYVGVVGYFWPEGVLITSDFNDAPMVRCVRVPPLRSHLSFFKCYSLHRIYVDRHEVKFVLRAGDDNDCHQEGKHLSSDSEFKKSIIVQYSRSSENSGQRSMRVHNSSY